MNSIILLKKLTDYATDYREDAQKSLELNRHMNNIDSEEIVQQRHIDAVLVDFINYVGIKNGCDYALYTEDLNKK